MRLRHRNDGRCQRGRLLHGRAHCLLRHTDRGFQSDSDLVRGHAMRLSHGGSHCQPPTPSLDSDRRAGAAICRRAAAFAPYPDRRPLRLAGGWGDRRCRLGLGQRADRDAAAAPRARSAPRVFRWRTDGIRPAARPGGHRVPAARMAGAVRDPVWRDAQLPRHRPCRRRQPTIGRPGQRQQPDPDHHPVPPCASPPTHLGGYSGGDGLATKRWLLALEARAQPLLQPIPSAAA